MREDFFVIKTVPNPVPDNLKGKTFYYETPDIYIREGKTYIFLSQYYATEHLCKMVTRQAIEDLQKNIITTDELVGHISFLVNKYKIAKVKVTEEKKK